MAAQAQFGKSAVAAPGDVASCDVSIRNTGPISDTFRFEVHGETSGWAGVNPSALDLEPGAEGVVRVVFRVPRSPQPAAGALPVDVSVHSLFTSTGPFLARGLLRIAPRPDLAVALEPPVARGRCTAHHALVVRNNGNVPMRASIEVDQVSPGLAVTVSQRQVTVGPAATAIVAVKGRRRRPLLWGEGRARHFRVRVLPAGGRPASVEGAMEQEAIGWSLRVAGMAGVSLLLSTLGVVVAAARL